MSKDLQDQVFIYSLDTSNFYNDNEYEIHLKLMKASILKKKTKEKIRKDGHSEEYLKILKRRNKKLTEIMKNLKDNLNELLENNTDIRALRDDGVKVSNVIGTFSSTLTRTLGMKKDKVSLDLMVVRAFYYRVLKDLIEDGFIYNNEKYIYFSSSAGQIRTKKTVFIKENLWETHKNTLTCGLSTEEINAKGGCNVNKLLAYKALTASASVDWKSFDITKSIVVPDLESPVTTMFDSIDRETYSIERKELTVDIEHTDGCGMILPRKSKKSFMVRMPYVKGLLVPFDFVQFANEKGSSKVTDIYGKVWDVIEDDIEVIFTASQFKMKKYYEDWEDYKNRFMKYDCKAVRLNIEHVGEEDASLNYQMLQTLTDMTVDELKKLAEKTNEDIHQLQTDKDTMLRVLGATKSNRSKTPFQEALMMYPELLNDSYAKTVIKEKRNSMVKQARAGKLRVNGKYTYLVPDLYAFCEKLFLGIDEPAGLLDNGEIYCDVFEEGKVDVLRSPHLYKEHAVRMNDFNEERKKWFITQGIYTSVKDPISRILQFDK